MWNARANADRNIWFFAAAPTVNGNVGYQNCPNAGPARHAACIAFWRPHGSWASRPAPEARAERRGAEAVRQ
jgi:hypothetical protein